MFRSHYYFFSGTPCQEEVSFAPSVYALSRYPLTGRLLGLANVQHVRSRKVFITAVTVPQ